MWNLSRACRRLLNAAGPQRQVDQQRRAIALTAESIRRCASNYSVEITPVAAQKVKLFQDVVGLHPGTSVNVTFLVGADIEDTIGLCRKLVDAGLLPVAHMPARAFPSLVEVEDYIVKLVDVGVREVLVLGGGASEPAGSLSEAMHVLESGLLQKHGIRRVGVAAHPEGHPDVDAETMDEALLRKAEWSKANCMDMYYATQFCFEAEPIIAWEQRTRASLVRRLGTDAGLPGVRLGVAGPAKMAALLKFALMSGVGPSVRFVSKYAGNVAKLATTSAPDALVAGIAAYQAREPRCLVRGLHYYSFGGFASTIRWANAVAAGEFDLVGQYGFQAR